MSDQPDLSNFERQELLHRFIEEQKRVSTGQISREFSVSAATARRDLKTLETAGKVQRIRGGALAIQSLPAPPEPPLSLRSAEQADEKRKIGQIAANLINNGETIFLGSGTTVLEVAHSLRNHRDLTVITNSLLVINALVDAPEIKLVGLGGRLRSSELSFIGYLTEQALTEFHVDKVVMGIRAIDIETGLTNDYMDETRTDRIIFDIGKKNILVADHTKCERVSTVFVKPISIIHTFVTDTHTSPDFIEALTAQGIRVLTT
jgi:DeoR family transcriptional regulator, aga operon transcriptional repressor